MQYTYSIDFLTTEEDGRVNSHGHTTYTLNRKMTSVDLEDLRVRLLKISQENWRKDPRYRFCRDTSFGGVVFLHVSEPTVVDEETA